MAAILRSHTVPCAWAGKTQRGAISGVRVTADVISKRTILAIVNASVPWRRGNWNEG